MVTKIKTCCLNGLKRLLEGLSKYVQFLQHNRQMLYAIILIILVPLILAGNTFFVVDGMGKNMDYELRLKAELAGSIIATYSSDILDKQESIQSKLEEVVNQSLYGTIRQAEVLVPEGDDYKVFASTDTERLGEILPQWHYAFVDHEDQAIATLFTTYGDAGEERVWKVVTPIHGSDADTVGLVEISVSTRHIDVQTRSVLVKSFIVLLGSVVIVLLLIATNAQLFEYAVLFHKLKEVDEMKDEFISVASHELKTPVTAARGFLDLVQQQIKEDTTNMVGDQVRGDIDKAVQCLDRLSELVADLLDVSRIEQNRLKVAMELISMTQIVDEVVSDMKLTAENKGIFLMVEKPSVDVPEIMADEGKLRQVVTNIIGNAIKYTFEGRVEVIINTTWESVMLNVKDTGIGMSAKDRERLFEKFYRVKNRKAKDVVGTGLGLWITKQLVEIMGGKIYVDSIEDVGSEFTIEFPIYRPDGKKAKREENHE
ncbi:MAG TPA: HAMP domain-containing sensor histidine kinase [bacterium]|nr:HAMP domain-containing sensor histidine kinase [bacterium]